MLLLFYFLHFVSFRWVNCWFSFFSFPLFPFHCHLFLFGQPESPVGMVNVSLLFVCCLASLINGISCEMKRVVCQSYCPPVWCGKRLMARDNVNFVFPDQCCSIFCLDKSAFYALVCVTLVTGVQFSSRI